MKLNPWEDVERAKRAAEEDAAMAREFTAYETGDLVVQGGRVFRAGPPTSPDARPNRAARRRAAKLARNPR